MSHTTSEPLWRTLLVSIVPIFLGSFLFAGILEAYKNDASARKEIMSEYYRPMRATYSECHKTHNALSSKYGDAAGVYQLMQKEFVHLTTVDPSKITREYGIYLESIASTQTTVSSELNVLNEKLELCRAKLIQQYGELALVTGTYPIFDKLLRERATNMNRLYAVRKAEAETTLKGIDANELLNLIRSFLQTRIESQEQKDAYAQQINKVAGPLVQSYIQLGNNEHAMLEVDLKLFEDLHEIFAKEISGRFERGITRYLF